MIKIDEKRYKYWKDEHVKLFLFCEIHTSKHPSALKKHPLFHYFYKTSSKYAMPRSKMMTETQKKKSLNYIARKLSDFSLKQFKTEAQHIQNCKNLHFYFYAWIDEQNLFHKINKLLKKAYELDLDNKLNKKVRNIYANVHIAQKKDSYIYFEYVCFLIEEAFEMLHRIMKKHVQRYKARKKAIKYAMFKKRIKA